jgi:menaquinone-specific isochorismate synthase
MLDLDSPSIPSIDEAGAVRRALAEQIRDALGGSTNGTSRITQVRVSLPSGIDPFLWLRAKEQREAAYWSARNEAATVATLGAADVVTSAERPADYDGLRRELRDRLSRAGSPVRYYGGLRFDAAYPTGTDDLEGPWAEFGTYRFVLPRFELRVRDDDATLACNLVIPRDVGRREALLEVVHRLALPATGPPVALPEPFGRTDVPDRQGWIRMVRWALDAIADRALDKVVLARRVGLDLGTALDPFLVLRHLRQATPGCFHFAVQPAGGAAFIGASPERLFRRRGDRVVSEAVAGTRPRGETPEADAALRDELLESPKERREHAFVQDAIRTELEALCTDVDDPQPPSDLALTRERHLHAPLAGTLRPDTSTLDLLDALHPTPAVGGVPTDEALAAIRTQEPFDRGWYAGPVGWLGADAAEFAVAIRSGLVQHSRLALFSGAGIVEGSKPDREWEEIEQKIGDFASILGLDGFEEELQ